MNKLYILIYVTLVFFTELNAQTEKYIVKQAPFCSRISDEFSPVFYKGGIVFCSNERDNSLVSYKDEKNRLFKIFFAAKKGITGWTHPVILAKEITSAFNDGPATFNEKGNIIYYSRNNSIENTLRNTSDTANKLGIYSAELVDGIWTDIKPFPYNNSLYSVCMPSLAPEGDRIYFSSDMPGGQGGMDLYYCDLHNNNWDKPVNLGPVINTPKNESFPFACRYAKLYFASDGLKGLGGKDLYYTQEINGEWIAPVHLDSAINSTSDDFGIAVDSTLENGYFSTNRLKTDDIFTFNAAPIEFTSCDTVKENNYCFTFYDEKQQLLDTIKAVYLWTFGDGIVYPGKEVRHCFPGPGIYSVSLTIIDELTGDTISKRVEYKAEIENIEQAYIKSDKAGVVDKLMSFNGLTSDLKGVKITDYFWDFGKGFKPGGPLIDYSFKKRGEYMVRLGLLAEKDSQGVAKKICVMKKIKIN
jgi:PKD repeat protein